MRESLRMFGVKTTTNASRNGSTSGENLSSPNNGESKVTTRKSYVSRRSFLGRTIALSAATMGAGMLTKIRAAQDAFSSGGLCRGDAALLRFPAALETLEADFWIQYNELGGIQDDEVPGGSGNEAYSDALELIEDEMGDYIHGVTEFSFPRTTAKVGQKPVVELLSLSYFR